MGRSRSAADESTNRNPQGIATAESSGIDAGKIGEPETALEVVPSDAPGSGVAELDHAGKPLTDEMRTALHNEGARLQLVSNAWYQEHLRLKNEAEHAGAMSRKAQAQMQNIEQILSYGKLALPPK